MHVFVRRRSGWRLRTILRPVPHVAGIIVTISRGIALRCIADRHWAVGPYKLLHRGVELIRRKENRGEIGIDAGNVCIRGLRVGRRARNHEHLEKTFVLSKLVIGSTSNWV